MTQFTRRRRAEAKDNPPANVLPSPYFVFAAIGSFLTGPPFTLPSGIGDMCFPPALLSPGTPGLLVVGDAFGLTGFPLPAASVPGTGSIVLSGPVPPLLFTVTIQAVILDFSAVSQLSVTNALRLTTW